jgi:hypothetical protein
MRAMEPFLCARHRQRVSTRSAREEHGFRLGPCCFQEAKAIADAKALEDKIAAMRLTSADALIRRLNGR